MTREATEAESNSFIRLYIRTCKNAAHINGDTIPQWQDSNQTRFEHKEGRHVFVYNIYTIKYFSAYENVLRGEGRGREWREKKEAIKDMIDGLSGR